MIKLNKFQYISHFFESCMYYPLKYFRNSLQMLHPNDPEGPLSIETQFASCFCSHLYRTHRRKIINSRNNLLLIWVDALHKVPQVAQPASHFQICGAPSEHHHVAKLDNVVTWLLLLLCGDSPGGVAPLGRLGVRDLEGKRDSSGLAGTGSS